jgi:hypothetical protein
MSTKILIQSKTNRRRANEPQRYDIIAEDENTSGFISACGGMCERSADREAKEIDKLLFKCISCFLPFRGVSVIS